MTLLLLVAAACSVEPRPPAATPQRLPAPTTGAVDAGAPERSPWKTEAPATGLDDRLVVLPVMRGQASLLPLPEGMKRRPHLRLLAEERTEDRIEKWPGWEPQPTWLPDRWGGRLVDWHVESDGSATALFLHRAVLFDRDHRAERALDFAPHRGDLVRFTRLCCEHAMTEYGTRVSRPRRFGDALVAIGTDAERGDDDFLIAVDSKSGKVYWKTSHDAATANIVLHAGHVFASSRRPGTNRYRVRVFELDTGRAVGEVETVHGPYLLHIDPDDPEMLLGFRDDDNNTSQPRWRARFQIDR